MGLGRNIEIPKIVKTFFKSLLQFKVVHFSPGSLLIQLGLIYFAIDLIKQGLSWKARNSIRDPFFLCY